MIHCTIHSTLMQKSVSAIMGTTLSLSYNNGAKHKSVREGRRGEKGVREGGGRGG